VIAGDALVRPVVEQDLAIGDVLAFGHHAPLAIEHRRSGGAVIENKAALTAADFYII